MRSPEEVTAVLELRGHGLSASEIARRTGIPRATVRDWVGGSAPRGVQGPGRGIDVLRRLRRTRASLRGYAAGVRLSTRPVPGRRVCLRIPARRLQAARESGPSVPGHHRRVRGGHPRGRPWPNGPSPETAEQLHGASGLLARRGIRVSRRHGLVVPAAWTWSKAPPPHPACRVAAELVRGIRSSFFGDSSTPTAAGSSTPAVSGNTPAARSATGLTTSSRSSVTPATS